MNKNTIEKIMIITIKIYSKKNNNNNNKLFDINTYI